MVGKRGYWGDVVIGKKGVGLSLAYRMILYWAYRALPQFRD